MPDLSSYKTVRETQILVVLFYTLQIVKNIYI